ncbi:hypothetical protein [uncultured Polaribacter sp.]|uniref:hypothetical protein n=1 Tax=uncultured Polaribacter sp. TaxID=174711 RepID=UPI0034504BEB
MSFYIYNHYPFSLFNNSIVFTDAAVTDNGKTKITPTTGINKNNTNTNPLPMAKPLFF